MIPEDHFNGLNLWTTPLWSGFPLNSIWLKLPDSPGTLWLGDSSSNIHGSSPCSNLRITSGLGMQNPVNDNYMTWDKLDECQGLWYTVLKEYTIKKKSSSHPVMGQRTTHSVWYPKGINCPWPVNPKPKYYYILQKFHRFLQIRKDMYTGGLHGK